VQLPLLARPPEQLVARPPEQHDRDRRVIRAADRNEVMREQLGSLIEHGERGDCGDCGCRTCQRYRQALLLLMEAFT
jgi:hypothetical protein